MLTRIVHAISLIAVCSCQSVKDSTFTVCKNRQIISSPVLETIQVKSKTQCAVACLNRISCGSSNYEQNNGTCELVSDITSQKDCENVGIESNGEVLRKTKPQCIYGGVWNFTSSRCEDCDYGFTGMYCERHIIDCAEGKDLGYTGPTTILIQPVNAKTPIMVNCGYQYGVTEVEHRDSDPKCGSFENFNRSWTDYKHGFGSLNCEFFIGLETLHLLTSQRDVRLKLQLYGSDDDFVNYSNFVIDNEVNRYTMHYRNYSTSASNTGGDGFGLGTPNASVNHSPFCTYDRDCGSCARDSASGWWFNVGCSETNLHIPLGTNSSFEWPRSEGDSTKMSKQRFRMFLFPM